MKRNIKITIEYDGTNYCGWQKQSKDTTIQGVLQDSIYRITGETVHVAGSGRTDSGVHAAGQVANFFTKSKIPGESFARALNANLPADIVIVKSQEVSPEFHAQYHAKAKAYNYRIFCRATPPALVRHHCYWVYRPLDVESMREASRYLIGTHDFSSFEAANSPRKSNVRTVNYIDISEKNCYIAILIEANGFLYRMVRNIVGTLIIVGYRRICPQQVAVILKEKKRKLAGPTAPAKGLCLQYVVY